MLASARQVKDWIQFLPTNAKDKWKAKSEDTTHGWLVTKIEGTNTVIDAAKIDELKSNFLRLSDVRGFSLSKWFHESGYEAVDFLQLDPRPNLLNLWSRDKRRKFPLW